MSEVGGRRQRRGEILHGEQARQDRRAAPARRVGKRVKMRPRWLFVLVSIGMVLLGLVIVVKTADNLVDILRPASAVSRRADGW